MRSNVGRIGSVVFSALLGVVASALAVPIANKICYNTACGGYHDQACAGTGACSFCSGGAAEAPLCFNKPGSTCNAVDGATMKCGKIATGTCYNGICSNSTVTGDDCWMQCCLGAIDPPPIPDP